MLPSDKDCSETNWPLTNRSWSEAAVRSAQGRVVWVMGGGCYWLITLLSHCLRIHKQEGNWDRQPWWKQPWKLLVTFWFLCRHAALISRHYFSLSIAVSDETVWKLAYNLEAGGVTGILWTWKLYLGYKSSESQASTCMKDTEEPHCSIVPLYTRHWAEWWLWTGWLCSVLNIQACGQNHWRLELFTKYVGDFFHFLPLEFSHLFA